MFSEIRLGMITVVMPFKFLPIGGIKPDDRTRPDVNARIRQSAKESGVRPRYLARQGKKASRLDAGKRYQAMRGKIISGRVMGELLFAASFYGRLVRTQEKEGSELKIQICPRGENKELVGDGLLGPEHLAQLIRSFRSCENLCIRGLWVNTGSEGDWANLVIGPNGENSTIEAPIRFGIHDNIWVVQVPD